VLTTRISTHHKEKSTNHAIIDSGAEEHIVPHAHLVHHQTIVTPNSILIKSVSGNLIPVTHSGTMTLTNTTNDVHIDLHNVLVAPGVTETLISVPRLVDDGHLVSFTQGRCDISTRNGQLLAFDADARGICHALIRPNDSQREHAHHTSIEALVAKRSLPTIPECNEETPLASKHDDHESANDSGDHEPHDNVNPIDGTIDNDKNDNATTSSAKFSAELLEFGIDPDSVMQDDGKGKKKLINLLHERLGHLNFDDVKRLLAGNFTTDASKF
jgi:hypothetical protein